MIRHIIKSVWYRKKTNALIASELFVAFLVLFGLLSTLIYFKVTFHRTLGFDYSDTWVVQIDRGGEWRPEMASTIKQLILACRGMDQVTACEPLAMVPYGGSTWTSTITTRTGERSAIHNSVGDGIADMMNIHLVSGRWFGPEDDRDDWTPVIINQRVAEAVFGDENPLGQFLDHLDKEDERKRTVVGVFDDFRQHGEFSAPTDVVFMRYPLLESSEGALRNFVVKIKPDTTAAFEPELVTQLQKFAPGWQFFVEPLDQMRSEKHKEVLLPLSILGVVAGFLLLMVALGILGVLWQNVTQRRQELGLKRALGASKSDVRWQIVLELMVLTGFAVIAGSFVAVQVPITGLFGFVDGFVFAWGLLAAATVLFLLTFLCTLYPSWLSTRIRPAEALHYD